MSLKILPSLFLCLCLVQSLNALTECETFLKDNAEFVENAATASCMDSARLFFMQRYAPTEVHMAKIQEGKLDSHIVFRCKVENCKNEGETWEKYKQGYADTGCLHQFAKADSARWFSSFKKFICQMENLKEEEFDSLYLKNDRLCNLYVNKLSRLFTMPPSESGLVSVKNDSVLYIHGAGLDAGVFLGNFRTGEQRKIFDFFHRSDEGFETSSQFKIVESSDSTYRVKYAGGDEVFYNGKDSTSFFVADTSGFYFFVRYEPSGDSVLHSNAPEKLNRSESYRMDEFTAHRYLLKTKRYRISFYGTDTADARRPLYRKRFPFERIGCSLF